jgi:hypothetical protein
VDSAEGTTAWLVGLAIFGQPYQRITEVNPWENVAPAGQQGEMVVDETFIESVLIENLRASQPANR